MTRLLVPALALLPSLCSGGCLNLVAAQNPPAAAIASAEPVRGGQPVAAAPQAAQAPPPNASAATWQMPWQISPIASASQAAGEEIILSYVPQTGLVRGTKSALAGLGRPLPEARGPNRTVNTCREVVQSEATKAGAKEVEAVSAGAEQRDRKGRYFAPVHVRVTYNRPTGLEVRESTMTCIVDSKNKIVDAYT